MDQDDMDQRTRPCPTCGEAIPTAFQKSGPKYCSDDCKPRCAFDGCIHPRRKREFCTSHYNQLRRGAGLTPLKAWSTPGPCRACGSPDLMKNSRMFCSANCKHAYYKYDGNIPTSTNCVLCSAEIDLTVKGKRGQKRKTNTKLCKPCKQDYGKYKMSARQLAQRDGATCGICHKPVDMNLRRTKNAKWCASVDHIIPRSHGGGHGPDNLQLAHLYCNQVKSDRVT